MSTEQNRQEGGLNRMTPARRAQQSIPEDGGAAPERASGSHTDDVPDFGDAVVVAIDGPAGSGKSSVSREAARRLDFEFLDTGAAYRALAWHGLDTGLDFADENAIVDALDGFDYSIGTDPESYSVWVGRTEVTAAIREPRVTGQVSAVAKVPEVRRRITLLFRRIIGETRKAGIIVEGRDITTVVAPTAGVRILLTASEEARMARRSREVTTQSAEATGQALRSRDRADSQVVDFMNAADGVTLLDSTHLDFEQTVDAVIAEVRTSRARADHGTGHARR
ncbi:MULTISPECIES: (d)CMP kinase [Rathayibacter]|jgi:cytidylate kinase|nr:MULTISPECIES: (d)CMP kinase [Rathayibacter]MCJ1700799.1 (d)CMP kinase [Rathayibacter festucae]MCJ1705325.1 (d)CMP kinase [Rathayibacter sp. VKM Ac-2926]MDY0911895.1 (d)CMP kinase [Rathayibacter festucae]ROP50587.1 cytidylate kinase [Rathayibacter sp. PhB186]ROQ05173.1 cytidylate kinase [Rathayibacter sp. PhB93]